MKGYNTKRRKKEPEKAILDNVAENIIRILRIEKADLKKHCSILIQKMENYNIADIEEIIFRWNGKTNLNFKLSLKRSCSIEKHKDCDLCETFVRPKWDGFGYNLFQPKRKCERP